ncbi:hypothetical protein HDZ31DRAFT_37820 [Schizophyllum fasciatum]
MITDHFDNDPKSFLNPYSDVWTSEWACIQLYVALFGVTLAIHGHESITYKCWALFTTAVLCAAVEILGCAQDRPNEWEGFGYDDPLMLQTVATIIGPTPLLAAHYCIMGNTVRRLGAAYSCLSPVLSAVINFADPICGPNRFGLIPVERVISTGITLHIAIIVCFMLSSLDFLWRYTTDRPYTPCLQTRDELEASSRRGSLTPRLKLVILLLAGSTVLFLVRALYRKFEMADGWGHDIVETEVWFNIFDAAIVIVAISLDDMLHLRWSGKEDQSRGDEEEEYLINGIS